MSRTELAIALIFSVGAHAAFAGEPQAKPSPRDEEFFESKIRPLLVEHCQSCHGDKKQKGELRLDSRTAMLKGNDLGPVIQPGDPEHSRLIQAIRYRGEVKMPPTGQLPEAAIDALTTWVKNGAVWPAAAELSKKALSPDVRKSHWAFQPVKKPAVPHVAAPEDAVNPIDAFILAKLEAKGLSLAPPADRRTLLRRITFDLTGLPPTEAEVSAFVGDQAPNAFEKEVDRLLNSPRYGERWGRHWLDVARYADSKGYVFLEERRFPFSYTYRDYVIRAFNEDLSYDRFIIEQLAADRLPLGEDKRPLAAMGFLTLGRRFLNNTHDIIDDRLDVTIRGLMGLTVGCARCHDHKFDPIPQHDYYSLYGVFASSVEPKDLPLLGEPPQGSAGAEFSKELARLKAEYAKFEKDHDKELKAGNRKFREELRGIQKKIDTHLTTHPGSPPRAMVLNDSASPNDARVLLRGNPNTPGERVNRHFLHVMAGDQPTPFHDGSGRLELARAIADNDNPLTARVMVNRVWGWHFGRGLVTSPSNFGLRGDLPSHPELLDWLATRFVSDGWSIKGLHRLIVLSRTYQQSSADRPELERIDPENRLLGRINRQRLDFEQLHDSLLFVAGQLDETRGGRAVDLFKMPFSRRRAVYGFIDRQNVPGVLRTFDVAGSDMHAPTRHTTTVPQQALYLLNNPFVLEQCRALARSVPATTSRERIECIYRIALSRSPTKEEIELGISFVNSEPTAQDAWPRFVQVLLLSNEFAFID